MMVNFVDGYLIVGISTYELNSMMLDIDLLVMTTNQSEIFNKLLKGSLSLPIKNLHA